MTKNDTPFWVPPTVWPVLHTVANGLRSRHWRLGTAESCTGGLISACCTALAGSSDWFDGGIVSYANHVKQAQLGVDPGLLERYGAVSEAVARAMVEGVVHQLGSTCAVSVTGIAGPTGGSPDKPVGWVWFGWYTPSGTTSEAQRFGGDRASVRAQATAHALTGLLRRLDPL